MTVDYHAVLIRYKVNSKDILACDGLKRIAIFSKAKLVGEPR